MEGGCSQEAARMGNSNNKHCGWEANAKRDEV